MRNPLALPKNLVNSLAYCDLCTPPIGLGYGGIPSLPMHFDTASQTVHTGKLMEIDQNEKVNPGESSGDFLTRIMTKYLGA